MCAGLVKQDPLLHLMKTNEILFHTTPSNSPLALQGWAESAATASWTWMKEHPVETAGTALLIAAPLLGAGCGRLATALRRAPAGELVARRVATTTGLVTAEAEVCLSELIVGQRAGRVASVPVLFQSLESSAAGIGELQSISKGPHRKFIQGRFDASGVWHPERNLWTLPESAIAELQGRLTYMNSELMNPVRSERFVRELGSKVHKWFPLDPVQSSRYGAAHHYELRMRIGQIEDSLNNLFGGAKQPLTRVYSTKILGDEAARVGAPMSYHIQTGSTIVSDAFLHSSKTMPFLAAGRWPASIGHEAMHADQLYVIARGVAADLKVAPSYKGWASAAEVATFQATLEKTIDKRISERQTRNILDVIQTNSAAVLTPIERNRAERLADGFRRFTSVGPEFKAAEQSIVFSNGIITKCREGKDITLMLQRLLSRDPSYAEARLHLFGTAPVPESLRKLVGNSALSGANLEREGAKQVIEIATNRIEQQNLLRKTAYDNYMRYHELEAWYFENTLEAQTKRIWR